MGNEIQPTQTEPVNYRFEKVDAHLEKNEGKDVDSMGELKDYS